MMIMLEQSCLWVWNMLRNKKGEKEDEKNRKKYLTDIKKYDNLLKLLERAVVKNQQNIDN